VANLRLVTGKFIFRIELEFIRRSNLIYKLFQKKIFDYKKFQELVNEYYKNPERVLREFGAV